MTLTKNKPVSVKMTQTINLISKLQLGGSYSINIIIASCYTEHKEHDQLYSILPQLEHN